MTRKPIVHESHHAFLGVMQRIPEWKIRAMEITKALSGLKECEDLMRKQIEQRIRQRGEVATQRKVDAEMSRINYAVADELSHEIAEGRSSVESQQNRGA
ncbi:hypothetical protein MUP01_04050 [Candidatus Bathyarchaeota archaeon]|nr:hypothetical protein [Candidatus Bathyarchaeota archaeon]